MQHPAMESKGLFIVAIQGGLSSVDDAQGLHDQLADLLSAGRRHVALDLSRVESIDSHGIGKLLTFYKRFKDVGGELQVSAVRGKVAEIFRSLMLDRLFHCTD